jgi:CRP-like cAMP-binding protein
MSTPDGQRFRANKLLAALPADEYQRLLPSLEAVTLQMKDGLYKPNTPIEYIYFPTSGMASILVTLGNGTFIEAGIAGNEGMVGLPVFLGVDQTPTEAFYQIAGEAARIRSDNFRAEINRNGTLASLLQRYVQAHMMMLSQNAACNGQHTINERCARWLLLSHDRVGEDQFTLTQEFLSQMLGVRRAGVNLVMQTLQNAGYIRYSRGTIHILNRVGLEGAACECYRVIAGEYKRLLS